MVAAFYWVELVLCCRTFFAPPLPLLYLVAFRDDFDIKLVAPPTSSFCNVVVEKVKNKFNFNNGRTGHKRQVSIGQNLRLHGSPLRPDLSFVTAGISGV